MKIPRLPKTVYSALGDVPVKRLKSLLKTNILGRFRYAPQRVIDVAPRLGPETAHQVLGHEIFHKILCDSGLDNSFTNKQSEALCDAFGTWLAGAVIAGKVVLK